MTEWRIKEISELTNTSIRMLRHYDKIGLLKPSYRSSNGYRCYTALDLAKLQQVIALRYFGFSLSTIKGILQKHQNIYAHLQAQQQVLKEQSIHLQQVNETLESILTRLSPSETPDWNDLIKLIERYRMTENLRDKLKKTWAAQLNDSLFEEYLAIYEQFPKEFAEREKMMEQINNKKVGDPDGADGERIAKFMYDLAKKMKAIFTKHIKFSSSLIVDVQSGKVSQFETTPEGTLWLSKAMISYKLKRWNALYDMIIENLKSDPESKIGKKIADEWTKLIDEYLSMGSRSFLTGILLWQDVARQQHDFKELQVMPTPQEMIKQVHIKLFFNPEAVTWIGRALEVHAK